MRTIAHISDLHFGKEDYMIMRGLLIDFELLQPSLIVISGDLTQRGRISQYQNAQTFLALLKQKYIVVPGNHDIPLFDLFTRSFSPLNRYKRFISEDLSPFYLDDELAVLGLNTARSMTWKNGRISYDQIKSISDVFSKVGKNVFKVLVTHHPFIPPPGDLGIKLVGRSKIAMEVIESSGIELLLSGHLHLGYSGDVRTFYEGRKRSLISVQAGTAISKRIRNEPNGYNLIEVANDKINIKIRSWNNNSFYESNHTSYKYVSNVWTEEPA